MQKPKALILGSTGLIGSHLKQILATQDTYDEVCVAVRKSCAAPPHPRTRELVVNFDNMEALGREKVRDVFCCLGTTIKKAGSQEEFRKVDYSYPLEAGRVLRGNGAAQFLLVSALGADVTSSIFYNRVKGETERGLQTLGFPGLFLFRPSLLVGEREEVRPGEKVGEFVGNLFGFAFLGPFRRYRPIRAHDVALAMARVAVAGKSGVAAYESEDIADLAAQ